MGTNYYAVPATEKPEIQQPLFPGQVIEFNYGRYEHYHIGKNSIGWTFAIAEDGLLAYIDDNDVELMLEKLESGEYLIANEYNEYIPFERFFEVIIFASNSTVTDCQFDVDKPQNLVYDGQFIQIRSVSGEFS